MLLRAFGRKDLFQSLRLQNSTHLRLECTDLEEGMRARGGGQSDKKIKPHSSRRFKINQLEIKFTIIILII